MKKYLSIILLLLSFAAGAQVKIAADGSMQATGNYPVTYQRSLKGYVISVKGLAERNAIPSGFRDTGMIILVRDSSYLYSLVGGIANSNWQLYSAASGISGGDTTVFNVVIDSTGASAYRVLYGKGSNHIGSDPLFLYDSVHNKLAINTTNFSRGGNSTKLYVNGNTWFDGNQINRGNLTVTGTATVTTTATGIGGTDSVLVQSNGLIKKISPTYYGTGAGSVTNVTGSGNIASSGGTTPNITFTGVLPIASGGTNNGSLSVTSQNIIIADGTKLSALAKGSNGQRLNIVGGNLAWTDTAAAGGSSLDTTKKLRNNLYGLILRQSTWTSTTGYTNNGSTVSVVSNKLNFSGGANTLTQTLDYTSGNSAKTCLERYTIYDTVIITEKSATSYGNGVGVRSSSSGTKINTAAIFDASTGAGSGKVSVYGFGGLLASSSALVFSVNDTIIITCTVNVDTITATAFNQTTKIAPVTISTIGNGNSQNNTGSFAIFSLGGTFTVKGLTIQSNETTYADICFVGDSKWLSALFTARATTLLMRNYPQIIVNSGNSDWTADVVSRLNEIIALHPRQVVLEISFNDIGNGVSSGTWQANYANIVSTLQAAGIRVFTCNGFYSTGTNAAYVLTENTYVNANYASQTINTYTPTKNYPATVGTDSIHLTNFGQQVLAQSILNSNALSDGSSVANLLATRLSSFDSSNFAKLNSSNTFNSGSALALILEASHAADTTGLKFTKGGVLKYGIYFNPSSTNSLGIYDYKFNKFRLLFDSTAGNVYIGADAGIAANAAIKIDSLKNVSFSNGSAYYDATNIRLSIGGGTSPANKLSISTGTNTDGVKVTGTANSISSGFSTANSGSAIGQFFVYGASHSIASLQNKTVFNGSLGTILMADGISASGASTTISFRPDGYDAAAERAIMDKNAFTFKESIILPYVAKTGTYTITAADNTVNCTSGSFTVTLPTAVSIAGRFYTVVNSGSGTITIGTTSSQTFTNITSTPTTLTMGAVGAAAIVSYTVMSDGANWIVTGKVKNE